MTRNRRTLLLAAVAVVGVVAAVFFLRGGAPEISQATRGGGGDAARPGGSPAAAPRSGYDNYRLIHTRNVFDPDRRPIYTGDGATVSALPGRTDYAALTGTMFDAKRSLAFFSGTRAEYNKVLSVNDRIAGAAITQITPASIEIERDGKKTVVAVGQTVPLDAAANPGAAPVPVPLATMPIGGSASATGTAAIGTNSTASTSLPPISSSKADEIRRRMEERRRQEQK